MPTPQSTSAVLMVRPLTFTFNPQTAVTNSFQNQSDVNVAETRRQALSEFDDMVAKLQSHYISVYVFDDPDRVTAKPDAVFPNNWLSTWPNGDIFIYPMATENRRTERSFSALGQLAANFRFRTITNLTEPEQIGAYLESTGAMVFDHQHKLAYACISPRCDRDLFIEHATALGYKPVIFHAFNSSGTPIYHTNVMMGVQTTTAVICSEAINDPTERAQVLDSLRETKHEVIEITQAQMNSFCGNVLELQNQTGELFLALSQSAYEHFTQDQRNILGRDKTLLPFKLTTIESIGGGSARCMLAEIFLKRVRS